MTQPLLPLVQTAQPRRRGRPPGARNKRSADLAKWVEATMGGMTPGQQAAELAMVKPAELSKAKAAARELGIIDLDLPPLALAMVVKAERLARALGIARAEAWILMQRERSELMPYIHQKQAQAADTKGKALATVFMIPEGEAGTQQLADFTDEGELEFIGEIDAAGQQVGQPKSDDPT